MNNVYALAIYEMAIQNGNLDALFADFKQFMTIYENNSDLKKYLSSILIEAKAKKELINNSFVDMNSDFKYALYVLIDGEHINELDIIFADFKEMYYKARKIKEVILRTNQALDKGEMTELHRILDKKYPEFEVVIEEVIDKDELPGYELYADGKRISASLASNLERLKRKI